MTIPMNNKKIDNTPKQMLILQHMFVDADKIPAIMKKLLQLHHRAFIT